jgi:hypothetical protein
VERPKNLGVRSTTRRYNSYQLALWISSVISSKCRTSTTTPVVSLCRGDHARNAEDSPVPPILKAPMPQQRLSSPGSLANGHFGGGSSLCRPPSFQVVSRKPSSSSSSPSSARLFFFFYLVLASSSLSISADPLYGERATCPFHLGFGSTCILSGMRVILRCPLGKRGRSECIPSDPLAS